MSVMDRITAKLAAVFANGKGEVGLEVGTDAGLPEDQYIQVPQSMVKRWAAKHGPGIDWVEPAAWDNYTNQAGWVTTGNLTIHRGHLHVLIAGALVRVEEFHIEPVTADDLLRFITVNMGHIRDDNFDEQTRNWIHAIRFWGLTTGLVSSTKNREFTVVDNPVEINPQAEAIASFVIDYEANAWTAAAARAGTWRKTGHCTGGDLATNFARSWLQKEGYMAFRGAADARLTHQRNMTSAFYVGTHAISVHAALALHAPSDVNHWAEIDPKFGLFHEWTAFTSAEIRLTPNTQVAGVAMVADAVVVLNDLVREGLAPLLQHIDQVDALMEAYETVRDNGIACASYATWFLEGHPNQVAKVPFNQKSSQFSSLVGELGYVATKYYAGTTIAGSKSLENAALQMSTTTIRDTWATLGRRRAALSSVQITRAYAVIRGANSAGVVQGLLSDDEATLTAACTQFNATTARVAARVGITRPPVIEAATIRHNAQNLAQNEGFFGGDAQ